MGHENEYNGLRDEILHWQSLRYTVLGANITVVTVILSWIISRPADWNWDIASIILLVVLSAGSYMIMLFDRFEAKIGTYIGVFYENGTGWETRVIEFDKHIKLNSLRYALGLMYFGLGMMSILIPLKICAESLSFITFVLFLLTSIVFITILICMVFVNAKKRYVKMWKELKKQEDSSKVLL
jgi:hypothetical protein